MTANRGRIQGVAGVDGHRLGKGRGGRFPDAGLAPSSEALIDRHPLTVPRALTLKSVTAPVAISIARGAGLREHLPVVGVMMSGMFGMVAGPLLQSWFGSTGDRPDLGIALGCAAHGLGTARAFEIGPTAGAFASVSMGLSALSYGVLLPPILSLV
jgi:putative effector of murein hydrolase